MSHFEYRARRIEISTELAVGAINGFASELLGSEFRGDNILPAIGGGLRFKVSPKYNLNFRVNLAQGNVVMLSAWVSSKHFRSAFNRLRARSRLDTSRRFEKHRFTKAKNVKRMLSHRRHKP
jgi:hypothetical protein